MLEVSFKDSENSFKVLGPLMIDLLVAKIYCHERLLLLIGDWSGSTLNFVKSKTEGMTFKERQ